MLNTPRFNNRKSFIRLLVVVVVAFVTCFSDVAPDIYAKKETTKTAAKKSTQKKKTTTTSKTSAKTSSSKPKARGKNDVTKEKQQTQKEIDETQRKIKDNDKKIKSQLDRLSDLDSQIERQEVAIEELMTTIEELEERSALLSDSILVLQKNDSILCLQVGHVLRQQHVQKARITPLAFVTSSASVSEARQRLNYLGVMQRATNNRVREFRKQRRHLEGVRAELDSVQQGYAAAVKQLATAKTILDTRRRESAKQVKELRGQGTKLNKALQEKKSKIKQLNAELDRIIAEEQRKAEEAARKKNSTAGGKGNGKGKSQPSVASPKKGTGGQQGTAEADRKLSGSFASNKGKLLFPVAGKYSIVGTFGRSRHSELDHVQVDNSGIDISVAPSTKARAVFDGTVSSVFFMDGYENIIIVRHGEYLTVYAGLASINVRKGDKVKAGQTLGTIATFDGNTVLHFEVRKEKIKLNPLQWVK